MKKLLTLSAVAFLLAALGSCSGSTTATQSTATRPMEEMLATIDGVSNSRPYAALLDEAAPRCQESRDDIGDMTVKAVELVKKANKETSNLDMLTGLVNASREFDGPQKCTETYTQIVLLVTAK